MSKTKTNKKKHNLFIQIFMYDVQNLNFLYIKTFFMFFVKVYLGSVTIHIISTHIISTHIISTHIIFQLI